MITRQSIVLYTGRVSWLLCWLLASCSSNNSLELILPDGFEVTAESPIRIQAVIIEQGAAPADDSQVSFATEVGSFEPFGGDVIEPVRQTWVGTIMGKAEAKLYSFPGVGGDGTLSATYQTINQDTVSSQIKVKVASGPVASGARLSASCDSKNVAVFADSVEAARMKIRCVVRLKDISGNPVPKATLHWRVENGCLLTPVEEEGNTPDTYVFALSPSCEPVDVDPIDGEPNHYELGRTRNPRDGLLSIVFYTQGEEGYVDSNGNGQHDLHEDFVGYDLSEPFLDVNDNNERDFEEWFLDLNDNGKWDPANGKWDANTTIWTTTRIMFTGKPHQSKDTTRFEPTSVALDNGATKQYKLYLMDINHNPLAANSSSDGFDLSVEGADLTTSEYISLINSMGIEFTDTGRPLTASFELDRSYQFTLTDADPDPQSVPTNVTLQTQVQWTPAPTFEDYSANEQTISLNPLTGTSN